VLRQNPYIKQEIQLKGYCEVKASTIKEVREPRLMTKHDSKDGLPTPLAMNHLNVLSVSRSSYLLGEFDVFEKFPEKKPVRATFCELPDFETLRIDNITSESNAINALIISGALDRFLGTEGTVETFNGRMGTGQFDFSIGLRGRDPLWVDVNSAQLEIDGGFENDECVVIMEAKNVIHDDFNIRQLYYPFRKYRAFVHKPIRLVFSQYNNLTYTLYEYAFDDVDDFNSIQLLGSASYTFEDDSITADDIMRVWRETQPAYDDCEHKIAETPFPQADRLERIFGIMEFLLDRSEGATTDEVTEYMGTVGRQAAYYPAAGVYLGVLERTRNNVKLSPQGYVLISKNRRGRLLEMVKLMFRHEIFHRLYRDAVFQYCDVPPRDAVMQAMDDLHVLGDSTDSMLRRRAQTVMAWLRWILELPDDE